MSGIADIIIAVITAGCMLVGNLVISRKQSNIILYRIEQLEDKQDKHNGVIKKYYILEERMKHQEKWLSDIEKKLH